MKEINKSGSQIARDAGINQPTVWAWKKGKDIRLSSILAISQALGIDSVQEMAKYFLENQPQSDR